MAACASTPAAITRSCWRTARRTVTVFLSDVNDAPISAAGFKANAILLIGGKSQRFPLEPADGSKLVGTAPTPVKPGVKGAIQLTAPDGTTAQGKF